jgi:outer membrane protein assembly factor BamE (lipoprotein component of BamABCDE complex)
MKNCSLILAACFLAACQPKTNPRGNTTVEENFSGFVVGKTTTNDVLEKCGTPSLHKDNYSWIYVGSKVEENTFGDIKLVHRFTVRMTFDENKILKSIEKIDPKNSGDAAMDEEIVNLTNESQASQKVDGALKNKSR